MRKIKSLSTKNRQSSGGKFDIAFLGLVMTLLVVGLIMLFSASYSYAYTYYGNSFHFIIKQFIFAAVGVLVMFIVSRIDYHIYRKFAVPIYIIAIVLLIAVYGFPPIANVHRWITVGPIQFQPSEIGKFAIIVLFAHLISKNSSNMDRFSFIAILLGLLALVCGLVVFETHVSATVLILGIGIVMIYVGGLSKKLATIGVVLMGVLGVSGYFILTKFLGYASNRMTSWLDPWSDPVGAGYQTIQSLLAIGSGGVLGRGLGQSRLKHLWVPEPHNDFIFSIVCEELGLIGAMVIIIIFCALIWRGFVVAMRAKDKFGSLLALGLTFQVGLQVALNIMVVTNTIPNTGISLPFFSYGGTALIILLAEMGVVLSVSRSSSLEKT
ncbi:MAG: cell division protein FtsW [Clostridia bacterium]|nr:cell division protein FtsW [Clostridia bacterium]